MKLKFSNELVCLFAFIGIILFIMFIVSAMFFYPGGIKDDPSITGYSFWGNTFSDLGRTIAWNGDSNLVSMILFSLAYGLHAITMVPFYFLFSNIFRNNDLEKKVSKIGLFFGILSSIAIIGIIFTPADILYVGHWIFVYIGYPSLLFLGISNSIILFLNKKFTRIFAYAFIVLILIFFVALLTGLIGITASRTIMVIAQKIMRIAILASFSILIYATWKYKSI
jgi:hypothetical protein